MNSQPSAGAVSNDKDAVTVGWAGLGELLADALRYWERRRPLYNGALTVVVLAQLVQAWPRSRLALTSDGLLRLFVLAVLANVCYCASYAVDLFAQLSTYRLVWLTRRWSLFAIGTAFAGALAHFISSGMFSPGAR